MFAKFFNRQKRKAEATAQADLESANLANLIQSGEWVSLQINPTGISFFEVSTDIGSIKASMHICTHYEPKVRSFSIGGVKIAEESHLAAAGLRAFTDRHQDIFKEKAKDLLRAEGRISSGGRFDLVQDAQRKTYEIDPNGISTITIETCGHEVCASWYVRADGGWHPRKMSISGIEDISIGQAFPVLYARLRTALAEEADKQRNKIRTDLLHAPRASVRDDLRVLH